VPITPTTPNSPPLPLVEAKDVFLLLFQQCLKSPNPGEIRTSLTNNRTRPDLRMSATGLQLSKSIQTYLANHLPCIDGDAGSIGHLEPNVQIAIAILARHATRINLMRAIELLPPTLPLAALQSVIMQSMEHLNARKNFVQILRQLLHSQRLRAHEARIRMEQATRLVVNNDSMCQACMKKIGKR